MEGKVNLPRLNILVNSWSPEEGYERWAEFLPEESGKVRVAADALGEARHQSQQAVQKE